jgi:hypothetical protein
MTTFGLAQGHRRKVAIMWDMLKSILIGGLLLVLLAVGGCYLTVMRPIYQAEAFAPSFASVTEGQTLQEVTAALGPSTGVDDVLLKTLYWNDKIIENPCERIDRTIVYQFDTLWYGFYYEISFDNQQRVIGKHLFK